MRKHILLIGDVFIRNFLINFNSEPITETYVLGVTGEHNASCLTIIPPEKLSEDERTDHYRVAVVSGGKAMLSEAKFGTSIDFTVPSSLTVNPTMSIQVIAYDVDGEFIGKSKVLDGFYFEDSIDSTSVEINGENADIANEIIEIGNLADSIEFSLNCEIARSVAKDSLLEAGKVDKVEGKELSSNDFTDELKQKLENLSVDGEISTASENPIKNMAVAEKFNEIEQDISECVKNDHVKTPQSEANRILTEADVDGAATENSVNPVSSGWAYGLASGLDGAYARKSSYELTAKRLDMLLSLTKGQLWDSQTDLTATNPKAVPQGAMTAEIKKIGGKTVNFNQLIPCAQAFFDSLAKIYTDISLSNDEITVTSSKDSASIKGARIMVQTIIDLSHNYLIACDIKTDGACSAYLTFARASTDIVASTVASSSDWTRVWGMGIPNNSNQFILRLDNSAPNGGWAKFRNIQVIDLTLLNDSLVNDYEAFKKYYPADYYPECEGSLVSFPCTSIISRDNSNSVKDSYQIPPALVEFLLPFGYGQSCGSQANYIDLERKKYYKFGSYINGEWVEDICIFDISDYFSQGNMISVCPGGRIDFISENQEYNLGIPSEFEFVVKLSEASQ